MCFPWNGVAAYFTASSWESTKKGQWDDLSGNGMHGNVTIGFPFLASELADLNQAKERNFQYVSGGIDDGIRFPLGTLPVNFTLCTVSKMITAGKGTVIDAVGTDEWVHGHWNGFAGVAYYGDGANLWPKNYFIPITQWLIMCGQNSYQSSIFNVDGRTVRNVSGGIGYKILSINDGFGRSHGNPSSWAVAEIIIWNRYLTGTEIDSVVSHLSNRYGTSPTSKLFRDINIAYSAGVKNLFVVSFDSRGQVAWHREAIGGNLV